MSEGADHEYGANTRIRVAALQIETPTGRASLVALNRLIGRALKEGAELVALAMRPLPNIPPRAADPIPAQLGLLAHGHGVALIAGPYIEREGEDRFLSYGLWDREGELVGVQRQTHLAPEAAGWATADTLTVMPLRASDGGAWRIGVIGGEDIRYPEVGRSLAQQGANLLVHIGTMPVPYNAWEQERRLWREAQANQTFGLESYPQGRTLAGHARVYAPLEMTADGRGILATTAEPNTPDLAVADLDEAQRLEVVRDYPINKFYNRRIYGSIADAYGQAEEGCGS